MKIFIYLATKIAKYWIVRGEKTVLHLLQCFFKIINVPKYQIMNHSRVVQDLQSNLNYSIVLSRSSPNVYESSQELMPSFSCELLAANYLVSFFSKQTAHLYTFRSYISIFQTKMVQSAIAPYVAGTVSSNKGILHVKGGDLRRKAGVKSVTNFINPGPPGWFYPHSYHRQIGASSYRNI